MGSGGEPILGERGGETSWEVGPHCIHLSMDKPFLCSITLFAGGFTLWRALFPPSPALRADMSWEVKVQALIIAHTSFSAWPTPVSAAADIAHSTACACRRRPWSHHSIPSASSAFHLPTPNFTAPPVLNADPPSLPTPPSPPLLLRVTPPSYPARSCICGCKTHPERYSRMSPSTSGDPNCALSGPAPCDTPGCPASAASSLTSTSNTNRDCSTHSPAT
ncbi:hypothetical protein BU17DRAFT_87066 [Hysterangium stoloniferum]|nr:hypothetical protein BU17DRAFT_87066 [Hysterangium stoloniferum]